MAPIFIAIGFTATAAATAAAITQALLIIGSIVYSRQQARKMRNALKRLGDIPAEIQSRTVTARDATASRQVVYGQCRVGGTIVLNHNNGSPNNKYKHLIVVMTGHEVEGFSNLQFDDEIVTLNSSGEATGRFAGFVQAQFFNGLAAQTAISAAVANAPEVWTTDHRLRGCAGVYIRLTYSADLFPNGVPNITALCKGKKVYDPRSDLTVWSDNAALCLADYLLDTKYGLGYDYDTEIDDAELIASANACDELVVLADDSTEKRYRVNGAFTVDTQHQDVIDQMKAAMAGFITDPPGRVAIIAGYYRTPTLPVFDEDTLCAGLEVTTKVPWTETFNRVKGLYVSTTSWQATEYPIVKNSTYLSQDNGEEKFKELSYTFVTSPTQSQRLGKIALEKVRQPIMVRGTGKMNWFMVRVGDVIQFTNARRGWDGKLFEVQSVQIAAGDGGALEFPFVLRETATTVYDWADGEETTTDPAPNTNLPSPFNIQPPTNLAVLADSSTTEAQPDATYIARMLVTWDAPADQYVVSGGYIRIQYKRTDQATWLDWGLLPGSQTTDYVFPVITDAVYVVRLRSENRLGLHSSWIYSDPTTATGDTTAPSAPTSFTAEGGVNGVFLDWTNSGDGDLSHIEVYEADTNTPNPSSGSTAFASVPTPDTTYFRGGLGDSVTKYYWIREVDTSNNKSAWVGPRGATTIVELTATANHSAVGLIPSGPDAVAEFAVTAEPSGGVGPFTYAWERVSGMADASPGISSYSLVGGTPTHTEASVNFAYTATLAGIISAIWRCKITDSAGSSAYTQNVLVQE